MGEVEGAARASDLGGRERESDSESERERGGGGRSDRFSGDRIGSPAMILLQSHSRFLHQTLLNRLHKYAHSLPPSPSPPPPSPRRLRAICAWSPRSVPPARRSGRSSISPAAGAALCDFCSEVPRRLGRGWSAACRVPVEERRRCAYLWDYAVLDSRARVR